MKKAQFYNKPDAPKPNKPNHMGVVAIIEREGKVLLEHRKDSDRWAFIGGGLKIDESIEECLKREVLEETGRKIESYELFNIFSNPYRIAEYPDGNILRIISVVYLAKIEAKEVICSEESRELQFFSIKELPALTIAETHLDIMEKYLEYKG
jgi:ADP-ribose pyrophosphatase YjhB (NUDIX family)